MGEPQQYVICPRVFAVKRWPILLLKLLSHDDTPKAESQQASRQK